MPKPSKKPSLASSPPAGYPGLQELDAGKISNGFSFREVVTAGALNWLFSLCADWISYFEQESRIHRMRGFHVPDPVGDAYGWATVVPFGPEGSPVVVRAGSSKEGTVDLATGISDVTTPSPYNLSSVHLAHSAWNGDPIDPVIVLSTLQSIGRFDLSAGTRYTRHNLDSSSGNSGGGTAWTGTHFITSRCDRTAVAAITSLVVRSLDGATWDDDVDLGVNFLSHFAASDGAGKVCLVGHADTGMYPASFYSDDHGATWSSPYALPAPTDGSVPTFVVEDPFPLTALPGEKLAMRADGVCVCFAGRSGAPLDSAYYWRSSDFGQSWQNALGPMPATDAQNVLVVGDLIVVTSRGGRVHTSRDGLAWETSRPMVEAREAGFGNNFSIGAAEFEGQLFTFFDRDTDIHIYRS